MKKQIVVVLLISITTLRASLLLTTTIQSSNNNGATWADTEYSISIPVNPSKTCQYFNGWCNIRTNMGISIGHNYVDLSIVNGTNILDMSEGTLFVPGLQLVGTTNTIYRPSLNIIK